MFLREVRSPGIPTGSTCAACGAGHFVLVMGIAIYGESHDSMCANVEYCLLAIFFFLIGFHYYIWLGGWWVTSQLQFCLWNCILEKEINNTFSRLLIRKKKKISTQEKFKFYSLFIFLLSREPENKNRLL